MSETIASIIANQNNDLNSSGINDNSNSAVTESKKFKLDFSFLKTETGQGEIKDYIEHPLNFNKTEGLAQIIRGVAGFTGTSLKLAILDILFGFFKFIQDRKKNIEVKANDTI